MDPANTKILIVEDDDFLRSLAVTKLQKEGFTVLTSANGEEGLESAKLNKPDVVLLDLLLPGIDGFEVLERIRKDSEIGKTRVIIFSNLGEEEDIKRGKGLGANDYLVKASFTLDELVDKIKGI